MKSLLSFPVLLSILLLLSACRSDSVPHPTFLLEVINGKESGQYEEGTVVPVSAIAPRAGLNFLVWTGDRDLLNDSLAATTEFLMPGRNVQLTATFLDTTHYELEVVNGLGGGAYRGGSRIAVVADSAPDGMMFSGWMGDTTYLESTQDDSTWFTMPYAEAFLEATYEPLPTYFLVVTAGSGSGEYLAGANIQIEANPPVAGYLFAYWEGGGVHIDDSLMSTTSVIMPEDDLVVTARYEPIPDLSLTVIHGSGSGIYPYGSSVTIEADPAPPNEQFIRWSGRVEYLDSFTEDEAKLVLEESITLEALFRADTLPVFSYQLDIIPIMNEHCVSCHYNGSNYSDMSNYTEVFQYRTAVKNFVESGFMPATSTPMPEEDILILIQWINQGAQNN